MAIQGTFFGLPLATLNTMLTNATAAYNAVLTTGASYTIGGRQLSRANLTQLSNTIAELQFAIQRASGGNTQQTYANMNPNPVLSGPQTNYQASAPGG